MISVVIPARNEESTLAATLDSLVAQQYEGSFEVVLVDNGSSDDTVRVAEAYMDRLSLRIVEEPVRGRGAARAAGFKIALGEIILSTDADTVVPPQWIDSLAGRLDRDNTIVAVTGTCIIADCRRRTNRLFNVLQPNFMRAYRIVFGHFWLTGNNFGVTREAYCTAGGFDPSLRDQEDMELGFRLQRVGRIRFFRQPAVLTSGRRYHDGLINGLLGYVKAFLCLFVLHIEFSRDADSAVEETDPNRDRRVRPGTPRVSGTVCRVTPGPRRGGRRP